MAKEQKVRVVTQTYDNAVTTVQPPVLTEQTHYPVGDKIINSLDIRFSGSMTVGTAAASAAIAEGPARFLREIRLEGDKRKVITQLPGQLLYWYNVFRHGVRPSMTLPALTVGTNAFSMQLRLPFADGANYRKQDTGIDVYGETLRHQITGGVASDILTAGSGGTVQLDSGAKIDITANYIDQPSLLKSNVFPLATPTLEVFRLPALSTGSSQLFQLPVGDRLYTGIWLFQRTSADQTLRSDVLTGNVALRVKKSRYEFDELPAAQYHDDIKRAYAIANDADVPAGVVGFDWINERGRVSDCLNTISSAANPWIQGDLELKADITAASGAELVLMLEYMKDLPADVPTNRKGKGM